MEYDDVFQQKTAQPVVNAFEHINSDISEFIIDDNIIGIRSCAFAHCKNLVKVKFSSNLKYIDDNAFIGCEALEYIELPSTIEVIGTDAFRNCKSLKEIVIYKNDNTTLTIKDSVFAGCESLSILNISKSVLYDGLKIFQNCKSLEYVNLSNCKNTTIPVLMFEKSGIKNIVLTDSIEYIEDCSFMDCVQLETINLNKVKKIGNAAFKNCTKLKNIEFPTTLYHIGSEAFDNCINLSTVIDNSSISVIYPETFNDCCSLTALKFNNNVFAKNQSFQGCISLSSHNVCCCEKYAGIDAKVENVVSEEKIAVLSSAHETEHERNNEITRISLKDVNIIEKEAFQRMYELKHIDLPIDLLEIQEGAFYNCFKLEEITIPKNVEHIPEECFYCCLNLKKVVCEGKIQSIGKNAFFNCINLECIEGIDFDDIMYHTTSFKNCIKLKAL